MEKTKKTVLKIDKVIDIIFKISRKNTLSERYENTIDHRHRIIDI